MKVEFRGRLKQVTISPRYSTESAQEGNIKTATGGQSGGHNLRGVSWGEGVVIRRSDGITEVGKRSGI